MPPWESGISPCRAVQSPGENRNLSTGRESLLSPQQREECGDQGAPLCVPWSEPEALSCSNVSSKGSISRLCSRHRSSNVLVQRSHMVAMNQDQIVLVLKINIIKDNHEIPQFYVVHFF